VNAEVAELADALGSGSSGRKAVRVQIPPSAPKLSFNIKSFTYPKSLTIGTQMVHKNAGSVLFVTGKSYEALSP
jgi:hypothetical protein